MLDVHPPHEAAHTWKDFFIHIATIVVGLLIAIGLEQTVERVHEHYQLRETREALGRERDTNHHRMAVNTRHWLEMNAALRNDLQVLDAIRHQPGIRQSDLPGDLNYNQAPFEYDHAVWDAAEKNGIIRLMPLDEANEDQSFYQLAEEMSLQSLHEWDAVNDQRRFLLLDSDPTHLTADELNETVRLTQLSLEKHVQFGFSFGRMADEFPDMPQTLTYKVVKSLIPASIDSKGLAAAHLRTQQRIDELVQRVLAGSTQPQQAPTP
jgi:hypothetical protein